MATTPSHPSDDDLPPVYDELVNIEQLDHGKYNPRCVAPKEELVDSIARDGIQQPLIVWYDETKEVYQVTDGWQRYQAATQLGWEKLPVVIHETALEALEAAESASIVREWSTYHWARYCQSTAKEIAASSYNERIKQVAARVSKSESTVDRYLAALALPEEVHVLLSEGPDGSEQEWQALQNHNETVRRYGDLSWVVAAKLGRTYRAGEISQGRAIALAANAVCYELDLATSFVELGCDEPEWPVQTIHRLVQQNAEDGEYLQVPRVSVPLEKNQKQQVMKYCAEKKTPLSELVSSHLQEFAEGLGETE
jgi:ParB/RepB/Spo0J family partition protein